MLDRLILTHGIADSAGETRLPVKVCILTNAPISQNPRVVKEADALCSQGYEVSVLFAQHAEWSVGLDRRILDRSQWRGHSIRIYGSGLKRQTLRYMLGLRVRTFKMLARMSNDFYFAELAFSRFFAEQLIQALREQADLYIAHNAQALPIAAIAAQIRGARYAFDSEDLHSGEYTQEQNASRELDLIRYLESKYLPGCAYVSAASPGIGLELARLYDIKRLIIIMNVFPWADRKSLRARAARMSGHPKPFTLYWYSQIVSDDRGLQDAVRAIGLIKDAVVELYIRGTVSSHVKQLLLQLALEAGAEGRVHFCEPLPPEKLLESVLDHDVGLCLEHPVTLNRSICVTNKLFLYLLAGVPIIASDTPGQRQILEEFPDAGFIYPCGDHAALASIIRRLLEHPALLRKAHSAALQAARERWNWEKEREHLLDAVSGALSTCRV